MTNQRTQVKVVTMLQLIARVQVAIGNVEIMTYRVTVRTRMWKYERNSTHKSDKDIDYLK